MNKSSIFSNIIRSRKLRKLQSLRRSYICD